MHDADRDAYAGGDTVTIDIDGHTITAKPQLSQNAEQILAKLPPIAG